jgi:DnaA family protein
VFNALAARSGRLLAAADSPPALLGLREDLRTRLSWGLVFEVRALSDAQKPAALAAYAQRRGIRLPADVVDYLLAHGRRDMGALIATLGALDRLSLATKRPITVPLVRDWLQRRMTL